MALISFRRIFPKSFYGRSLMLTLFPIGVSLIVMVLYYVNGHLRSVNTKLSQSLAREIALVQHVCKTRSEDTALHATIKADLKLEFICGGGQNTIAPLGDQTFFYADLIRQTLERVIEQNVQIGLMDGNRRLDIRVGEEDAALRVIVDRKRAVDINGHFFIVWVVGISLIITAMTLAFLRNHVRSILRLTRAAQAFGTRHELDTFRPFGAREVRAAARAIINMRKRLTRFAEQRTAMLAAVSHDLRTPLTRLQLQLALQEQSGDIKAARADIRDMERMLDEYLAFARGEDGEEAEALNLTDLVREVVEGFPSVAPIVSPVMEEAVVMVRPSAMKRAIVNLVSNAVTYADHVEVSISGHDRGVTISIDDDGPGIAPEDYEKAFRPFTRLDEARTQNKPGVGLGLSLARDTAESHGGIVTLKRSTLGGLCVEMWLPVIIQK